MTAVDIWPQKLLENKAWLKETTFKSIKPKALCCLERRKGWRNGSANVCKLFVVYQNDEFKIVFAWLKKKKFRAYICFDSQSSFGTDEEKKKLAVKFSFLPSAAFSLFLINSLGKSLLYFSILLYIWRRIRSRAMPQHTLYRGSMAAAYLIFSTYEYWMRKEVFNLEFLWNSNDM